MLHKTLWVGFCLASFVCLYSNATTIDFIYPGCSSSDNSALNSHQSCFDFDNTALSFFSWSDLSGYKPADAITHDLEQNLEEILSPNRRILYPELIVQTAAESYQARSGTQRGITLSTTLPSNGVLPELATITLGTDIGADPSLILMVLGSLGVLVSSRMD